ncbi:MAG: bifunctional (p)ppGpp synthetase/guanosine-3',5'-bis(diphosphate) 3'-pyrophosphohydrolase [Gammaproteobacteria bacterium]
MVKVRDDYPLKVDGNVDIVSWVERIQSFDARFDGERLRRACELTERASTENPEGEHAWKAMNSFVAGLAMARILVELKLDEPAIVAGILYRSVHVRVALIKLAERTCALRAAKQELPERQGWVAREIFDIYAPLAHRLGIGQLKWELEDLSFRYLEPQAYKHIAGLLYERRVERDSYIESVRHTLKELLTARSIEADVTGRSKHIYSIWRKMKRKRIDFFQVYDVRAVRVLVPTIADCYATLGIVHGLWQHIPKEFDDYIAAPKENGYRSLHTAVLGPGSKILEVQIRTYDMHDEAELGVCAHWKYKEGAKLQGVSAYDHKIAWLRQVIEWQDELGESSVGDVMAQIREEIVDERVYVFTPEGDVVDLQNGATPIDFAYQVHTEIGNRCRGAKVNDRIVPLNYLLNTGERVEILTVKHGGPSRDWLNPHLNYVRTSRARAKIQHWFKQQDRSYNISYGRQMLDRELDRLRVRSVEWASVAAALNVGGLEDIQAGLGAGDLRLGQVLNTVQSLQDARDRQQSNGEERAITKNDALLRRKTITRRRPVAKDADIEVNGVGKLLTHLAGCCKPVPGDQVVGYVSVGKGISVHREDCKDLESLRAQSPDRVVEVSWREEVEQFYPVIISISAIDRQGLLRDVSVIFANSNVNVMEVTTKTDERDHVAQMYLRLEVKSLAQLRNVMDKIAQLPSVIEVRRSD